MATLQRVSAEQLAASGIVGTQVSATATCPNGTTLISGGGRAVMRLNVDGTETPFVDELLSDSLSALTASEASPASGTPTGWTATAHVFGGTLAAKIKVYAWAICTS